MHFGFSLRKGFGLALGLAAVTAGSAAAQDTASRATRDSAAASDTGEVRNPPGYSGMERDTTMVPPSTTRRSPAADTSSDSSWKDSSRAATNPSGYKGAKRSTGTDTASSDTTTGDTTKVGQTESRRDSLPEARPPTAAGDTTGQGSSTTR